MDKNILITGANGFVGKYYENYSKTYFNISKISIRFKPKQKFDFNNDVVLHLSGIAHELVNISDSSIYYESNYILTKQVFDSFLISNASVFIFLSTVKASADNFNGILNEDQIENPATDYGKSKLLAEEYINSCFIPDSKRVYILRPCMIHGPGNNGNLNLLFSALTKFKIWPLSAFHNKRSLCSIDNLCFIINELIEREDIPCGVYNVADDIPLSTNEIVYLFSSCLGKKLRVISFNRKFITILASLGDYLKLPLDSKRLQKLTESYVVSNKKILNAIGKKLPVSSKEGLLRTLQSFSSNV
jgi:nucleoside-diphosphate-sugar epimerase